MHGTSVGRPLTLACDTTIRSGMLAARISPPLAFLAIIESMIEARAAA